MRSYNEREQAVLLRRLVLLEVDQGWSRDLLHLALRQPRKILEATRMETRKMEQTKMKSIPPLASAALFTVVAIVYPKTYTIVMACAWAVLCVVEFVGKRHYAKRLAKAEARRLELFAARAEIERKRVENAARHHRQLREIGALRKEDRN